MECSYEDENDRLSSLRSARYFAGLCVSCGQEASCEPLNPYMSDAPTHCRICANIEIKARDKAARRNSSYDPTFLQMLADK